MRACGQMLAFEPPRFGEDATLGGFRRRGLSGPRRPYAGAVRDLVLGVRMLDGKGEDLSFGGRVMKNVAGFDVARLMTGALGTLGVITEVSLKCVPCPKAEATRVFECSADEAIRRMNEWGGKPLPVSATCLSRRPARGAAVRRPVRRRSSRAGHRRQAAARERPGRCLLAQRARAHAAFLRCRARPARRCGACPSSRRRRTPTSGASS